MNAPILEEIWSITLPILDKHREERGDFPIGRMTFDSVRERVPELLRGIGDGARRIKDIVSNLKDFARQDVPNMDESVNINQVVRAAITLMQNRIAKSTEFFQVESASELPEIRGNFQRLEQVVINLINNACDALSSSGQAVIVTTSTDRDRNLVILTVKDEGAGMPEETLRRVFDPFYSTKQDSGGTGLGLSISDGIVRDHGGMITLESVPGKGSEVTVVFPIEDRRR
jgi:polar amino acid transport system substrate-binding protein